MSTKPSQISFDLFCLGDKRLLSEFLSKSLEKGKRYLKRNYPVSSSEVSTLRSHSTQFALCFEDDAYLNQTYSQVNEEEDCIDYVDLLSTLNQICDLVNQSNDGDLQYDTNVAIDDVKAYMKYQIRDVQQKLAKTMAFELLDTKTGFWLNDFCQKILPAQFSEGQKEYFGKKDMTHVDAFFQKVNG